MVMGGYVGTRVAKFREMGTSYSKVGRWVPERWVAKFREMGG
jgi:hypothetical protein